VLMARASQNDPVYHGGTDVRLVQILSLLGVLSTSIIGVCIGVVQHNNIYILYPHTSCVCTAAASKKGYVQINNSLYNVASREAMLFVYLCMHIII
jgi:hypothetical protein